MCEGHSHELLRKDIVKNAAKKTLKSFKADLLFDPTEKGKAIEIISSFPDADVRKELSDYLDEIEAEAMIMKQKLMEEFTRSIRLLGYEPK